MTSENPGFSPKRFAIIGAGPVGCIVGAFLSKGGYDVTLCDVIHELVDPAATTGITIEGAEQIHQKVTRTCHSVDELPKYNPDVIFITVKANALPLIMSAIEEFYKEGMYVISWQNGIDTELEVSKVLGDKPVMRGVVNWGCGLKGPCHVVMPFHHPPHYLQELAPESAHAAKAVARVLTECGLPTEHTDKIVPMVWQKSIMNSCMNPVCAVTGLTMAQATTDPIVFGLVDALMKECIQVARANDIFLGWDYYPKAVKYMKSAGNHKPSMLMDIENKRRTEIDYMNGKFIEYGIQAGIPTPYNSTLQSLVKGLESTLRPSK
ncbi:ketopantoate reductase family protein [Desulforhabdus sp. TSK]|uniref:ketopantoate reductase family protein n=1 Tax=Desulforhabdus sp. TSK TaxID=2925014 RepID=UPI001FC7D3AC|nr:2-dehydropantoate 2-reductase [Desulforhabdus sp. TSK]GKT08934.1 2-dehydropantoate 2-reductase [Desulforhabdus sp. TSK]